MIKSKISYIAIAVFLLFLACTYHYLNVNNSWRPAIPLNENEKIDLADAQFNCTEDKELLSMQNFFDRFDKDYSPQKDISDYCKIKSELQSRDTYAKFVSEEKDRALKNAIFYFITGTILIFSTTFLYKNFFHLFSFIRSYIKTYFLAHLTTRKKRVALLRLLIGILLVIVGLARAYSVEELSFNVLIGMAGVISMLLTWGGMALIAESVLRIYTNFYIWLDGHNE